MTISVYGDKPAKCVHPNHEKLDKPPTLLIKILSKREVRAWQARVEAAREIADNAARDAAYTALLKEVVVGAENVPDFAVEMLDTVYSLPDYMGMFHLIPMAMTLSPDDRKS